jgi:transposase
MLHQFYRAMGWLGTRLPPQQQQDAHELSPRCVKDDIEEYLFAQRRTLLSGLSLVFLDTTSLYFEGEGGATLGERGKSKDGRGDAKQIVVGVVLDDEGNPLCSEILPGNTTDVTILMPVAKRLKRRFGIERVCIVADRGMISKKTMAQLEQMGWTYILGARMRNVVEVRDDVLCRGGRYTEVFPARECSHDPAPLEVKEVVTDDHRYIVCRNAEEARKDRHDREAIVNALRDKLRQGDKSLVTNKGYRRYLKSGKDGFDIDEDRMREDERYDGKWVLQTNSDVAAWEAAIQYKQLWAVEEIFRTMKSILDTRPIFHHCDETIRGHVFCSFLALMLRKALHNKLEKRNWKLEWADIMNDIDMVEEIEVSHQSKNFIIRTECSGVAGKVFQAAGIALPPVLREQENRGTTPKLSL